MSGTVKLARSLMKEREEREELFSRFEQSLEGLVGYDSSHSALDPKYHRSRAK